MKHEENLIKKGAVQLDDEQLTEVSGGEQVTDGNCGRTVTIHDGLCKFHPDGIPNCNNTCPYYYNTHTHSPG